MTDGGQRKYPELSMRDAERIAAAFELRRHQVLEDAELVANWHAGEQDLTELLQKRNGWDATVAPIYLFWLRGDGADLAE